MALPVTNTTCDIYRHNGAPPAAPASADVACYLKPDWRGGQEGGEHQSSNFIWTHQMLVASDVDIRDGYTGSLSLGPGLRDNVYIPDKDGTHFIVVFVERVGRGGGLDHKRVYLDRQEPSWPTDDL